MKKILVLFLTVSTLALTSCGKDDSPSIIGKWYFYSTETNGKVETREYGKCGKGYTQFFEQGKVIDVEYRGNDCKKEVLEGSYSIKGKELRIQFENKDSKIFNFSIAKDIMSITGEEDVKGEKVAYKLIFKRL